jgi:hypothetical protein
MVGLIGQVRCLRHSSASGLHLRLPIKRLHYDAHEAHGTVLTSVPMADHLSVVVAALGTVGGGVLKLLRGRRSVAEAPTNPAAV